MTKKRQKSRDLVGFYFRIPTTLKEKIDASSEKNNVSRAQLVVDLLERGLDEPIQIDPVKEWLASVKRSEIVE